jgi:hypothetical protein
MNELNACTQTLELKEHRGSWAPEIRRPIPLISLEEGKESPESTEDETRVKQYVCEIA